MQKGYSMTIRSFVAPLTMTLWASVYGTSVFADGPWPVPANEPSSFENAPLDIKGAAMTMSIQEVQAALGGNLSTSEWRFFDKDRLSQQRLVRPDAGMLHINFSNTRQTKDDLQIIGSRWHTGNGIVRMTRRAVIRDASQQPLVDNLLASVFKKYGRSSTQDFIRGLPGLSNLSFEGFVWKFDGGQLSENCEIYALPNNLTEVYQIPVEDLEGFVADVETPEACDGYMKVFHSRTSADTVSEYMIEITDIRLLFADALNDKRVEAHIQAYLENSLKSGNSNLPDL